jgi:hypothetical protein
LEDPLLSDAMRNFTAVSAQQSFNQVEENMFGIYGECNNATLMEAGFSPTYLSAISTVACAAGASDTITNAAILVGNAMHPYEKVPIRTLQTCADMNSTSVCQILFYDDAGMEVDSCGVFVNGSSVRAGSCQVCVDDAGVIGVITDCPDYPIASTNGTCVPNPVLGYTRSTSDAGPLGMRTALLFVIWMAVSFFN